MNVAALLAKWKGAKFAGSVGHPMTKMLSASLTRGSAPRPPFRYRLVLRTHHGAPQPLTPSAAYMLNPLVPV